MNQETKRIVAIGAGHCNCQVLKLLKKLITSKEEGQPKIELTLINEAPASYYSGMLPGSVSNLYKDEDIMVMCEPLGIWCKANFIQKRVARIEANKNTVHLEGGDTFEYDILAINVGSRTFEGGVKGIWDHALTTRPINELLPKVLKREQCMKEKGMIPVIAVCGAGAAGAELAFGFKARWEAFFGQELKVTLIGNTETPVPEQAEVVRNQIIRKLKEKNIEYVGNRHIKEIQEDGVILDDGTKVECNVPIWATGAQPQGVTAESDLDMLKGFFRVNDHMQSTSHPNVFAGGDCVTMENYVDKPYPTKAGVYAVRAGPIIAQNLINYAFDKPLIDYVPQTGFLALMMTGDGSAIGAKFGICFVGKWVWGLKDYIDLSFMDLFNPKYLFKDYETKGTAEPTENYKLFDDDDAALKVTVDAAKKEAAEMDPKTAAELIGCSEEETEFHVRWQILTRMHFEEDYRKEVVSHFKPAYYP